MVNRFEFFGIALSIIAMAGALWLINLQENTGQVASVVTATDVDPIVVVGGERTDADIADAVVDASSVNGDLQKLIVDDVVAGNGAAATSGDTVTVNYIGTLQNGQEFDNSYKRGAPFTFTLGEGKVIAGWEQGLEGMQVGGQRILVIPSDLAYGDSGYGPIPGGATLVFAVELLAIE